MCCWCFPLCRLLWVRIFKCFASLSQSCCWDNIPAAWLKADISLSEGLWVWPWSRELGLQRGSLAVLPALLPSLWLSSHICFHAVWLTAEEGGFCLLQCLSVWGQGTAGMQGSPPAPGCCQCLGFFGCLLVPCLREVLPASDMLPRFATSYSCSREQPGEDSSGMKGRMESSSSAEQGIALLPLGHHGERGFCTRFKDFVTSCL